MDAYVAAALEIVRQRPAPASAPAKGQKRAKSEGDAAMAVDGSAGVAEARPAPNTRVLDGVADRALALLHLCNYDVAVALQLWRGEGAAPASVVAAAQELVGVATGDPATVLVEGQGSGSGLRRNTDASQNTSP